MNTAGVNSQAGFATDCYIATAVRKRNWTLYFARNFNCILYLKYVDLVFFKHKAELTDTVLFVLPAAMDNTPGMRN